MSELSERLATALPDNSAVRPEWLKALRESGAEQFRTYGLPTRKTEAWKYTALGALDRAGVQLPSAAETLAFDASTPPPLAESGLQLNLHDGQILAQTGEVPKGLTVLPLADAVNFGVDGLQALLESLTDNNQKTISGHGFSALNSATLESGVVIHVATGTDAGRLALLWSTSRDEIPLLFNSRICVILEADAKLELLEQFQSTDDNTNTSNIVLQADVGENAELRHIRFQQESDNATLITRAEVSQHADSAYTYYGFDLGGGLIRHDMHAALLGSGANASLNGAYLLDGNRHVDNHAQGRSPCDRRYQPPVFPGCRGRQRTGGLQYRSLCTSGRRRYRGAAVQCQYPVICTRRNRHQAGTRNLCRRGHRQPWRNRRAAG